MILFGDSGKWGVSADNGCLRFHPHVHDYPDLTTAWIWPEAWAFVESRGGFQAILDELDEMERIWDTF